MVWPIHQRAPASHRIQHRCRSVGARTNSYSYFATSSAFAGLLQSRVNGRGVSCTYGYDEWLRPTTNLHNGSLAEQNLTTILRFDVGGRMLSGRNAST